MNEIANKLLLVGDKCMPEMHLKQSGFIHSACGPFTTNKGRIEKFLQTGNTEYIYKHGLEKACFQHNMAYGKYKDLNKKTQSDKVLREKTFEIASIPKNDKYKKRLASMVYTFFDKKYASAGIKSMSKQQLANKFHKPIIVSFLFKNNIWGEDLGDMQLISKNNKGTRYLLCTISFFSKYAWVVSVKEKNEDTIANAFQSILDTF